MPVDFERSPKGNVIIGPDGFAVVHNAPVPGGRMAHHATCIHGEDWSAVARAKKGANG
jgi:hypothetical protein